VNVTRKIALLLAMVFLLPALFFSGYELSSLSKDETMIQQVYNRQLDAILFSINQYADDVMNRWTSLMENNVSVNLPADSIPTPVRNLLELQGSVLAVFVTDTVSGHVRPLVYSLDQKVVAEVNNAWRDSSWQDRTKINQLISYRRSGFRKVDVLPASNFEDSHTQWLVFILQDRAHQRYHLAGLIIEPELFVEEVIGPRLQEIGRDQFVLSVVNKFSGITIYNSALRDSTTAGAAEALTREFWLLPDYALGIRPKGASIQQLIRERTTTNMALLFAVDIILVVAVILVFRNVKQEVQLAQNKSDFVANVSHEIRTPLALISMFAETLEMGRVKTEEKKQEYYTIIHKEAHRLSGIVNKILNFSQAEADKKTYAPTRLHADTAVREILKTYDFHLVNKGFEYVFNECPDLYVRADQQAFTEAVINLIDNAVKYSEDKKRIEITCSKSEGMGLVAVKDYGVGIAKAVQKHVFDKFYRVPSGDLARSLGTGLGLALVKQLMEAQGGTISLASEPGKGSTFTLSFPLDDAN